MIAFAEMRERSPSLLVDDVLRGPILIAIGLPGRIFIVLRDRVVNAVAFQRSLDVGGGSLERNSGVCTPRTTGSVHGAAP